MTAQYIKEKWGVSIGVVRDRALIIPLAYKKKNLRWDIPDVDIPPITSHMAYVLLKLIATYKKGGHVRPERLGISNAEVDEGYKYLADVGYITIPSKHAEITELGRDLMNALSTKEIKVKVGASASGPYAEVEGIV